MAFSLRDCVLKVVTNRTGATLEKRIHSGNKFTIEPGPKMSIMKGFDVKPFAIIHGSAEPKWSLDGLAADEMLDIVQFVGGLYGPHFSLVMVAQRPGMVTRHVKVVFGEIGEGADWSGDEGSGATSKLGGPMRDVLVARGSNPLSSIFAPRVK